MRTLIFLALAILSVSLCSCVSARKAPEGLGIDSGDSAVDMTYLLGHSKYRLRMECRGGQVTATTYTDSKPLEEFPVAFDKYLEFKKKVEFFIRAPRRSVAADESATCRNPFAVQFTPAGASKPELVTGCRGGEDGGFGRLVRDGEFLIHRR